MTFWLFAASALACRGVYLQTFDALNEVGTAERWDDLPTRRQEARRSLAFLWVCLTWSFGRREERHRRPSAGQRRMRTVQGWALVWLGTFISTSVLGLDLVGYY